MISPKSAKWLSVLNCSKLRKLIVWNSHGEARNKFGQQVNLIQMVQFCHLPLEILTSSPHIMWPWTISLSLVTEGLLLSSLGSKNNSLIEILRAPLHRGSNVITFFITWNWWIFIPPVIERPQGLHSSTQTLKSPSTSCFKYFAMIKFSKLCKKDECSYMLLNALMLAIIYQDKTK